MHKQVTIQHNQILQNSQLLALNYMLAHAKPWIKNLDWL